MTNTPLTTRKMISHNLPAAMADDGPGRLTQQEMDNREALRAKCEADFRAKFDQVTAEREAEIIKKANAAAEATVVVSFLERSQERDDRAARVAEIATAESVQQQYS